MTIVLCMSLSAAKSGMRIRRRLEEAGLRVVGPAELEVYAESTSARDRKWDERKGDTFRDYYKEIEASDAILVVNEAQKGVPGYIGANTLIEMAFSYVLGKPIYLLNGVPEGESAEEIRAMEPIVLEGDLDPLLAQGQGKAGAHSPGV